MRKRVTQKRASYWRRKIKKLVAGYSSLQKGGVFYDIVHIRKTRTGAYNIRDLNRVKQFGVRYNQQFLKEKGKGSSIPGARAKSFQRALLPLIKKRKVVRGTGGKISTLDIPSTFKHSYQGIKEYYTRDFYENNRDNILEYNRLGKLSQAGDLSFEEADQFSKLERTLSGTGQRGYTPFEDKRLDKALRKYKGTYTRPYRKKND